MILFDGYGPDSRLFGGLPGLEGRLTDFLNATINLRIVDVQVERLSDRQIVESPELIVPLDELFAVVGAGDRGEPARRLRTRAIDVIVALGPYEVTGAIHGTMASNPLAGVLHRAPWVPLTDAQISYRLGEESIRDEVSVLIVNRHLASSMRGIGGEASVPPS
jgi:hypothetical protein